MNRTSTRQYHTVCFMVFNATFNNISVISWRSVLLMEKTTDLSQVINKLYHITLYRVNLITCTVRPVLRGHLWGGAKKRWPFKTGDLWKVTLLIWNLVWQDKKKVTTFGSHDRIMAGNTSKPACLKLMIWPFENEH
jgi:hypothetical protein